MRPPATAWGRLADCWRVFLLAAIPMGMIYIGRGVFRRSLLLGCLLVAVTVVTVTLLALAELRANRRAMRALQADVDQLRRMSGG